MAKKKKEVIEEIKLDTDWPKIVKGSHTTVTVHENGSTEIVTDWTALEEDIRKGIEIWEKGQGSEPTTSRRTRKKQA